MDRLFSLGRSYCFSTAPSSHSEIPQPQAPAPNWKRVALAAVSTGALASAAFARYFSNTESENPSSITEDPLTALSSNLLYVTGYTLMGLSNPASLLLMATLAKLLGSAQGDSTATPVFDPDFPTTLTMYPEETLSLPDLQRRVQNAEKDLLTLSFNPLPDFATLEELPYSLLTVINGTGETNRFIVEPPFAYSNGVYDNFQIWDITEIENPKLLGGLGDTGQAPGEKYEEYYYLPSGPGLSIIFLGNPYSPTIVSSIPAEHLIETVTIDQETTTLWFLDIFSVNATDALTNPTLPSLLGSFETGHRTLGLVARNSLLYFSQDYLGVIGVLNGTEPTNPTLLGTMPTLDVSRDIAVREDLLGAVAARFDGTGLISFVDPTAPTLIRSYSLGSGEATYVSLTGPYAVTSYRTPHLLAFVDVRNPQNPTLAMQIPFASEVRKITTHRNRLFAASNGVFIYDIHKTNLTFNPKSEDRGEYTITITADNGWGGIATKNLTLTIVNGNPVMIEPIPEQELEAGERKEININLNQYFSDPENDPLTLSLGSGGTPPWVRLEGSSLIVSPPSDGEGLYIVPLLISDSYGGHLPNHLRLDVKDPNTAVIIASTAVGSIALLVGGLIGGCAIRYAWKKRKAQRNQEKSYQDLVLSLPDQKFELKGEMIGNIDMIFGEGQYARLKEFSKEDRVKLFEQTGLLLDANNDDGHLGNGYYGAVHVCMRIKDQRFFAAKTIQKEKIAESTKEAELHKKAIGAGVWDITQTISGSDFLIHVMPLGGIGDLVALRQRIIDADLSDELETFASFVAKSLSEGLETIHTKNIYHRDIKCANALVDIQGRIAWTDFGCAIESSSPTTPSGKSDFRYQSPERRTQPDQPFRADRDDTWALGCLLLEFLTGYAPNDHFDLPDSPQEILTLQKNIDELPCFANDNKTGIWDLIHQLLTVDPEKRLTIKEALAHPLLKKVDETRRETLFKRLADRNKYQSIAEQRRTRGASLLSTPPRARAYQEDDRAIRQSTSLIDQYRTPVRQDLSAPGNPQPSENPYRNPEEGKAEEPFPLSTETNPNPYRNEPNERFLRRNETTHSDQRANNLYEN